MTVAAESADVRDLLSGLDFSRTVPKDLVHREALSELFLTDSRKVTGEHFVAAAQLPPSHAYWTDHIAPGAVGPVDPLLLLECCRQAETHAVHAHFGAPRDTVFVLQSWSMELSGDASGDRASPGGIWPRPGSGPVEVTMDVTTHDSRWREDSLLATTYVMGLYVAGRHSGEVRLRVAYLPGGTYAAMRSRRRGSTPPTSDAFRHHRDGTPVPPLRVGRAREENVILLDPVVDRDSVSARLRPAGEHPSFFDHPLDHIPGMVLMEAGRQLSLLAAGEWGHRPGTWWTLTGLDASFHAYAELDSPLLLTAHRPGTGADSGAEGAGQRLRVTFEQREETLATAEFTLTPTEPGAHRDTDR
ncbi:ScbA/BarX family gamma-butyrolactone biosynthesis protein [Streptomyces sp. NPDC051776]|uniref:ScbA/BarX family gamma-butyrolactone biosynthesis protein n=1 Tax=Streptomyces sp. NPDC051776 TaxID=3155414 RepID=UPI003436B379